jgi:hypothetical protein
VRPTRHTSSDDPPTEPPARWRAIRIAEGLYAVVALALWSFLPMRPNGAEWFAWLNLLSTAIVALLLAWRLRRPTRALTIAAAVLSGWVLLNAAFSVPRMLAMVPGAGPAVVLSFGVASLIWLTQLGVAVLLWRRRT